MASDVMASTCPDNICMGWAQLVDYRLTFTRFSTKWKAGVANVVPSQGDIVHGVLYEIPEMCAKTLDVKEGKAYGRFDITVLNNGNEIQAFAYQVLHPPHDEHEIPTSRGYRDTMLRGARENNLPEAYIAMIEGLALKA